MTKYNPVSTYRIQFNKDFTLSEAEQIVDYLQRLGVKTIYASPILEATKGSTHGYDTTNPHKLNSEIGTEKQLTQLTDKLHQLGMGWLQDIVPNHMAYSTENPWISDVLLKGKKSAYYAFFDIIHEHPHKQLMLPFFGKSLDELLKDDELSIAFDETGFVLKYFDNNYPVSDSAYGYLLKINKPKKYTEGISLFLKNHKKADLWDESLATLWNDYRKYKKVTDHIHDCLSTVNANKKAMAGLIDRMHYRPVHWQETEQQINYRRFFTINGLICLSMENEEVFEAYHQQLNTWLSKEMIDGFRIDHIDGLYNPEKYLDQLNLLTGSEKYLVVEKILEKGEELPLQWKAEGSTGYDFLGMVNNLLTNHEKAPLFYKYYKDWIDKDDDFNDVYYKKSRFILYERLKGELENLTRKVLQLKRVVDAKVKEKDLEKAVGAFLIYCPVYKIYNPPSQFDKKDLKFVHAIFEEISENIKGKEAMLNVQVLRDLFTITEKNSPIEQEIIDQFFLRCMQFTGPLMAKGIEDTAFYTYNPFIGHNEVGDSPGYFGIRSKDFHKMMIDRQAKWPMTMNTTATHDTKRGEDARARLNVLSDMPEKWIVATQVWHELNKPFKKTMKGKTAPSLNDEYLIYQVLCAHLPISGKIDDNFKGRLEEYLVKALREAKVNSSWSDPDEAYENKVIDFVHTILRDDHAFKNEFLSFMGEVIPHGIVRAISQLILKNTAPGISDTYQGSESWNFSFVDPDNRRKVDYKELALRLDQIIHDYQEDPLKLAGQLWKNPEDGKIKQWLTWLTLQLRRQNEELFQKGDYIPLKLKGKYKERLIAFSRCLGDEQLVVVLPINTLPENVDWKNTRIILPELTPRKWKNQLSGETVNVSGSLPVSAIFNEIPFAILKGEKNSPDKRAGILMHITSLPGEYGVGDIGKSSKTFVDFLKNSGQRYWQILPLNITENAAGHSPYSSLSAFAGNTLLIDPRLLVEEGLLSENDITRIEVEDKDQVNYPIAGQIKESLLNKAYDNFVASEHVELKNRFTQFKIREKAWLTDFATFILLKKQFKHKVWNKWPETYRDRDQETIKNFVHQHEDAIKRIVFKQFIFSEQLKQLKQYANEKGISIIGDIPIYVSYNSADVWSNPHLFQLKKDKSMAAVAGVPPDYFNENGQLWGMPLFDWKAHKKEGYLWWIHRIGRNLHWFDLMRLDHFRGFSAYWEVPGNDDTALNGRWVDGPGKDFFDTVKEYFPQMPFIAEDLGHIDQAVYDLRDRYNLPGMKVVQFGFGADMPFSQHNPSTHSYNSVVYTGTHDNNTMRGWYNQEADKDTLKRVRDYTGKKIRKRNAHKAMIRVAYASVGKLAIVPLQDWLGLDEDSRMNFPATTSGNWLWKLESFDDLDEFLSRKIRKMVKVFGRY